MKLSAGVSLCCSFLPLTVAYSDLFSGIDGAKDDFCKTSTFERSIADSADDPPSTLDDSHGIMIVVEHQSGNVFSGHFWELLLEQVFQANQNDRRHG